MYKGYYYDVETGLYYLNSRYYVPEWGRWLNADDVSYLDLQSINGINLYAYCENNPVMYIDQDGHEWYHWLLEGIAVIGVAALAVGITALKVGTATLGFAVALGALKGATIGFGVGAAVGFVEGYAITGTLDGALDGMGYLSFGGAVLGTIIGGTI